MLVISKPRGGFCLSQLSEKFFSSGSHWSAIYCMRNILLECANSHWSAIFSLILVECMSSPLKTSYNINWCHILIIDIVWFITFSIALLINLLTTSCRPLFFFTHWIELIYVAFTIPKSFLLVPFPSDATPLIEHTLENIVLWYSAKLHNACIAKY